MEIFYKINLSDYYLYFCKKKKSEKTFFFSFSEYWFFAQAGITFTYCICLSLNVLYWEKLEGEKKKQTYFWSWLFDEHKIVGTCISLIASFMI